MATVPQERRPSTLGLVRDAILSLTHIVEDSTELVGASIREELEHFRVAMARSTLSLAAVIVGASLLTAGLAMFVSELIGSWALTLVLFGVLYVGVGVVLQRGKGSDKPDRPDREDRSK
jgi:Putative Actinobacterial Holin-X, holin superfamily III